MAPTKRALILEHLRSIAPLRATNGQIRRAVGITRHPAVFRLTQKLMQGGLIHGEKMGQEWVFWVDDSGAAVPGEHKEVASTEEEASRVTADAQPGDKLPQNIQALIGEIGEKQVLLRLSLLVLGTPWQVFYNLGEAGYDILLLHSESGKRIRIEVKARQRMYTTGKRRRSVLFFLTSGEYEACDFLVAYYLDRNTFYIVPKQVLKRAQGGRRWRYNLAMNQQGNAAPVCLQYESAWGLIHPDFAGKRV